MQEDASGYIFCIKNSDGRTVNGNTIDCVLGGVELKMLIDSGSDDNIIDHKSWEMLKDRNVKVISMVKSEKNHKTYGGIPLGSIGTIEAEIRIGENATTAKFYVVHVNNANPLLGLITSQILKVLKIGPDACVNRIEQSSQNAIAIKVEQPKPLGKIKGITIDLPIDETVKPVTQPYRRVPVSLEEAVSTKIDDLLALGVIEPVKGAPTWISPMVVVPQGNDQVRICIDMRRANRAIKRENHPLPVIEDFLPHLAGGKIFSKLDISNAFHQVEISEQSRNITTFITNKGLFRYTR